MISTKLRNYRAIDEYKPRFGLFFQAYRRDLYMANHQDGRKRLYCVLQTIKYPYEYVLSVIFGGKITILFGNCLILSYFYVKRKF